MIFVSIYFKHNYNKYTEICISNLCYSYYFLELLLIYLIASLLELFLFNLFGSIFELNLIYLIAIIF